jgi:hypothetical protein
MEHTCEKCKSELKIANSRFKSEEGSTDVYSELDMVCINPKCLNYCGSDLQNPKTIVEIVRNKVN